MTATLKAKELIDKFSSVGLQQRDEGIQCSLICVNEILDSLTITIGHLTLRKLDRQEVHSDFEYWKQVKKEIEQFN